MLNNHYDISRHLVYELPVEEYFDVQQLTLAIYQNIVAHVRPLPVDIDATSVNEAFDRLGISDQLYAVDVLGDTTVVHIALIDSPIVH